MRGRLRWHRRQSRFPQGFHTITLQLQFDNAAEAIEWYTRGLGAREISRSTGPDGKILHAELQIGDTRFMANDAMGGSKGPKGYGGSPASMWLYVENSDALFERAVKAGATVQVPFADQFWGDRGGAVGDPAGYSWWIVTRKEDLSQAEIRARFDEFMKHAAG